MPRSANHRESVRISLAKQFWGCVAEYLASSLRALRDQVTISFERRLNAQPWAVH